MFRLTAGRFFSSTIVVAVALFLALPAEAFELKSSTQVLSGPDALGVNQKIVAEHLKFNHEGEGDFTLTGYGRVTGVTGGADPIRRNETQGRLYYLYLEYTGLDIADIRLGRQFTSYSTGIAVMDGATMKADLFTKYLGLNLSAGNEVVYTLDRDFSSKDRGMVAVDLHLQNAGSKQLGIAYARRYDGTAIATEKYGLNASIVVASFHPYAQMRYDSLSSTYEQVTAGLDWYLSYDSSIKVEYFQSYPVFDSTSIYSVFAVDRFSEYLVEYETMFGEDEPLAVTAGYHRQNYQNSVTADAVAIGFDRKGESLDLALNLEGRAGYGGRLYGGEILADYRVGDGKTISMGAQVDRYNRWDEEPMMDASRYWGGLDLSLGESSSLSGRVEVQRSPGFDRRVLARIGFELEL